jgi:hypothetical protein
MYAMCPSHFILLDFIAKIIFHKNHKLWNSSLLTSLHSCIPSSLLGLSINQPTSPTHNISGYTSFLLRSEAVSHPHNPQAEGPPLAGYLWLVIRYIWSYLPISGSCLLHSPCGYLWPVIECLLSYGSIYIVHRLFPYSQIFRANLINITNFFLPNSCQVT